MIRASTLAAIALVASPVAAANADDILFDPTGEIGSHIRSIDNPPPDLENWVRRTITLVRVNEDLTYDINDNYQYWFLPFDNFELTSHNFPVGGWCPVGEPGWDPCLGDPTLLRGSTPSLTPLPTAPTAVLLLGPLALAARRRR